MEPEKRKDPLTGEEFVPKKISQRFANPQNRVKYNNNLANALRQERAVVDKPINKAHRILKELMKNKKKETFHKQFLHGKGLDFKALNKIIIFEGIPRYALYEFIFIFGVDDKNMEVTIINNYDGRF